LGSFIISADTNFGRGSAHSGTSVEAPIWGKADTLRTIAAGAIVLLLLATAYFLSGKEGAGVNAALSLLIGSALGIAFERGRFCFFCIFRDAIEDRDTTPFLSIISAIAVGAIGYAVVFGQFLPDTSSGSLPPGAHIGPVSLALVVAGLAFGVGMALSGACISGHLYRIGQGSLRAYPALLGSLVGFGLGFKSWNLLYSKSISDAPTTWLPHKLGYGGALLLTLFVLSVIAIIAIKWGKNSTPIANPVPEKITAATLRQSLFINRWRPLTTGAIFGVIGTFAYLRIEPLGVTRQISTTSRTYFEGKSWIPQNLDGLDLMAGCVAIVSDAIVNNGWLILGIVLASFAAALTGNRFKFQQITLRNGLTALLGGVLLGWSSMIALGCTVGVLLSGTQSFALSGWVFFATVFIGSWLGIKLKLHKL
jgi:uncharacterized membrane protein YedE/YeeE